MTRPESYSKISLIGFLTFLVFLIVVSCSNNPETEEVKLLSELEIEKGRVELGRKLFFDKRLSLDNSISCASCHIPELAFTDGKKLSIGVDGGVAMRNAPTLLNVGDAPSFMFDAHISTLEEQAIVPVQDHNEMNIPMGDLIRKLKNIKEYSDAAKLFYQRDFDAWVFTRSLASYERSLVSKDSKFDQFISTGDSSLLSAEQLNGWQYFNDFACIECHSLPNFTNYEAKNNGLYIDYGEDKGRFRIFGDSSDMGSFKVPTLRNITLTAPYMHDGSIKNIEEVIYHYANGGAGHFNQDKRIEFFKIREDQVSDLQLFFEALLDTSYLSVMP